MYGYQQKIGCILLSAMIALSSSAATAGWFSKKPASPPVSGDTAGIWRIPAPVIHKGSVPYSVIIDRGELRKAIPDSHGRFLFSEKGAGVQCLAMIGTFPQILRGIALLEKKGYKIANVIDELGNKIYIGITEYVPKERFKMVDGLTDAVTEVVKEIAGTALDLPDYVDLVEGLATYADYLERYYLPKIKDRKKREESYAYVPLYLKICYLKEEGMEYIGTKELTFHNLAKAIERRFANALHNAEKERDCHCDKDTDDKDTDDDKKESFDRRKAIRRRPPQSTHK